MPNCTVTDIKNSIKQHSLNNKVLCKKNCKENTQFSENIKNSKYTKDIDLVVSEAQTTGEKLKLDAKCESKICENNQDYIQTAFEHNTADFYTTLLGLNERPAPSADLVPKSILTHPNVFSAYLQKYVKPRPLMEVENTADCKNRKHSSKSLSKSKSSGRNANRLQRDRIVDAVLSNEKCSKNCCGKQHSKKLNTAQRNLLANKRHKAAQN